MCPFIVVHMYLGLLRIAQPIKELFRKKTDVSSLSSQELFPFLHLEVKPWENSLITDVISIAVIIFKSCLGNYIFDISRIQLSYNIQKTRSCSRNTVIYSYNFAAFLLQIHLSLRYRVVLGWISWNWEPNRHFVFCNLISSGFL